MVRLEDIVIDPEFAELMPSWEDRHRLAAKIELEGWTDEPITVWQHHNILLDGHTRLAIYNEQKSQGIDVGEPQVIERAFKSRDAAIYWIRCHALSRRNLTPEQRHYQIGCLNNETKQPREGNQNAKAKPETKGQSDTSFSTAAKIAAEHDVSPATVKRAARYANAVDHLDKTGVVAKSDLLSGKAKVPARAVVEAAKAPTPEAARKVLESTKAAPEWPRSDRFMRSLMEISGVIDAIDVKHGGFAKYIDSAEWNHKDDGAIEGMLCALKNSFGDLERIVETWRQKSVAKS